MWIFYDLMMVFLCILGWFFQGFFGMCIFCGFAVWLSRMLLLRLAVLGCSGVLWAALGGSGLLLAAFSCSGRLWGARGGSGLLWVAFSCFGAFAALG